jgi:hypothetical protein
VDVAGINDTLAPFNDIPLCIFPAAAPGGEALTFCLRGSTSNALCVAAAAVALGVVVPAGDSTV